MKTAWPNAIGDFNAVARKELIGSWLMQPERVMMGSTTGKGAGVGNGWGEKSGLGVRE